MEGGVRMEGDRLWADQSWEPRHHLSPLISLATFSCPGQGCIPSSALEQTQVMEKQTSNSLASGFHCKSPRVSGCAPAALGEVKGMRGTLTLSTDRPLPAFFADTREGLAIDHTGAPIMAGTGQAATVSGYKTRADKTMLPEDPGTVCRGKSQTQENSNRCSGGHAHCASHVGHNATYVAGCSFPASRTHALESIPFIIAGATIVACGLITLAVTWRSKKSV